VGRETVRHRRCGRPAAKAAELEDAARLTFFGDADIEAGWAVPLESTRERFDYASLTWGSGPGSLDRGATESPPPVLGQPACPKFGRLSQVQTRSQAVFARPRPRAPARPGASWQGPARQSDPPIPKWRGHGWKSHRAREFFEGYSSRDSHVFRANGSANCPHFWVRIGIPANDPDTPSIRATAKGSRESPICAGQRVKARDWLSITDARPPFGNLIITMEAGIPFELTKRPTTTGGTARGSRPVFGRGDDPASGLDRGDRTPLPRLRVSGLCLFPFVLLEQGGGGSDSADSVQPPPPCRRPQD
jgi:hypothetical protein